MGDKIASFSKCKVAMSAKPSPLFFPLVPKGLLNFSASKGTSVLFCDKIWVL